MCRGCCFGVEAEVAAGVAKFILVFTLHPVDVGTCWVLE